MVRLAPDMLKRIRRFNKNAAAYIRMAIEKQLARDEKKKKP